MGSRSEGTRSVRPDARANVGVGCVEAFAEEEGEKPLLALKPRQRAGQIDHQPQVCLGLASVDASRWAASFAYTADSPHPKAYAHPASDSPSPAY